MTVWCGVVWCAPCSLPTVPEGRTTRIQSFQRLFRPSWRRAVASRCRPWQLRERDGRNFNSPARCRSRWDGGTVAETTMLRCMRRPIGGLAALSRRRRGAEGASGCFEPSTIVGRAPALQQDRLRGSLHFISSASKMALQYVQYIHYIHYRPHTPASAPWGHPKGDEGRRRATGIPTRSTRLPQSSPPAPTPTAPVE